MKTTEDHPCRLTDFDRAGVSAPDPAVLASLAVQLCAAGIVPDKKMEAAVKCAALWWIEARRRCEKLMDAEVLREAAQYDIDPNASVGDMDELEVMKLVKISTRAHFRERAKEFFAADWAQAPEWIGETEARRLKLFVEQKETVRFQASDSGGRKWHRGVAVSFKSFLDADRSQKATTGGLARHSSSVKSAAEDSNSQAKKTVRNKSASAE